MPGDLTQREQYDERNKAIYLAFSTGSKSRYELAEEHGVSPQRISQIIAKWAKPATEEESRHAERLLLEATRERLLKEVVYGPRQIAVSATGQPVYDLNGNPVYESRDLVGAIDAVRKLSESIRKLDAIDLPRKKELSQEESLNRVREYLSRLPKAEVISDEDVPQEAVVQAMVVDGTSVTSHASTSSSQ